MKIPQKIIDKKYWLGVLIPLTIFLLIIIYHNRDFIFRKNLFNGEEFNFPNSSIKGEIILEESGKMKDGKNSDLWLNSGGLLKISEKEFSTNLGKLPENSVWRKLYNKNNSRDTDDGYYPQNIFRLVTKSKWQNFSQSIYFYIEKINLSESEYRNESNGILFFNRYQDGDNLYYTGLRVDGDAVIKKKIEDKYYTLKEKSALPKEKKYDRVSSPNLIPLEKWIGMKSEIENIGKNEVKIRLYLDLEGMGNWQLILEAKDKGDKYGKAPFLNEGYAGMRTDFMDVKFRDYKIVEQ